MSYRDILVYWGEIALKGKNRPVFIDQLIRNINYALADQPLANVRKLPGRLWLESRNNAPFTDETLARLRYVYGVAHFSPMRRAELNLEAMKAMAWEYAREREYETFRITARRPFKDLPFNSQHVSEALGAHLIERKPRPVKMKGAQFNLRVELLPQGAFFYADRQAGPGGLPVGVTGRVCALLSGGIDSPVAAARMMQRGCRVTFVHFHGHPYVSKASLEKAEDMAAQLARYQYEAKLYAVPFGDVQRQIVEVVPPPLRVVIYRRFMLRIAEAIAHQERCKALVTGEALGQVASQTLTNLVTIDEAAAMPVLRPLLGMDKMEIRDQAEVIGTYPISLLPDQDCCTLFTPKRPETHASLSRVRAEEAKLDVPALVAQAVEQTDTLVARAPWYRADLVQAPRLSARAAPPRREAPP